MTLPIPRDDGQWRADVAVDLHAHGTSEPNLVPFKAGPQFTIQRRIIGFPYPLSHANPSPVDIPVAELQHGFGLVRLAHLIDATALLPLVRLAGIENDAVTRFY